MSDEIEPDYDYMAELDAIYGTCPQCGTTLQNWGAASHGDGDIFDEWGCPLCEEVIHEIHASYCTCQRCL